jgi:hypothetical protein
MTAAAAVAADPAWLPHVYNSARRSVQFVRFPVEVLESPRFLADYRPTQPADEAWLDEREVASLRVGGPTPHFIFHTALCRSTLLVRALHASRRATGLNEPGILNSLGETVGGVRAGTPALLSPCLALLSRPRGDVESSVIKPSNVANALIPGIMASQPHARAIMMSNSLQAFCGSVHRKGLMGRRWARRLTAHVQRYAPLDLGLDDAGLFELTDMQVAGLAWLLQQRWFAILLAEDREGRMRTLDADEFAKRPAESLSLAAAHFGMKLDGKAAREVVASEVFTNHAKLGGSYAERVKLERRAADSRVVDEEIEMVSVWIAQIASQTGLVLPVAGIRSLLP